MKQFLKSVAGALAAATWLCASSGAAQLPSRIAGQINTSERVEIAGTATHRPATSTLVGHLPGNTSLTRMGLVLAPSATQQADLDQLLADQVNPASPRFHQWLTPAQFGARFGVSDADLTKIESWLTSQGFDVLSVPASRNTVFFSGTAATVESAFGVSMEQYRRNGQDFFENSKNVQLPAALSGIVQGVTSLSSYRLKGSLIKKESASLKAAKPQYTETNGTTHTLTPWDFRQIYGLNTLVNAGYTGQLKIAVVGQSAVNTTQIGYFQQLTGQAVTAPTFVLVPNSGISTLVYGDEGESEIDIEYAGGTASGASIQFVYTGDGSNNGVFDSVIYAVTQDLAPIITMSYGGCETDYTTYASQTFEPYLRQANAQGQTVLVSAGDEDAATCDVVDSTSGTAMIASEGATVSYPASSPYVTAVGGTRFSEGSGTYWNSTNNSFGGSATGYIPEIVWNETSDPTNVSQNGGDIVGTGGGASALFGKPSWQIGTGVPTDGARDLPDVAFNAAIFHDPYQYCSAEIEPGATTEAEACTASTFGVYIVGGTSLSAPNFAGMLAIVEQKNGLTTGLGNINPSIYSLAAGSSASAVFNDVTIGNNTVPCIVGTPDCTSGTLGYVAGVGYDQTTGWGSVNGAGFAAALAAQVATAKATPTVTVSATPAAPIINSAVTLTAAVASASLTTAPTGTVQFTIDGTSVGSETIASGSATYTVSAGFTTAGTHTVVAAYSGDGNYSATTSTLDVIVGASVSSSGTFSLTSTPTTLSISAGGSGAETIAVTPVGGFLGVVDFVATESGPSTLNACYTLPDATVTASGGSAALTIYTSAADCATAGRIPIRSAVKTKVAANSPSDLPNLPRKPAAILLGGALLGCFALRRRSRLPLLFTLALCAALIPGMGCGSGGSTSAISGSGSGSGTTTTGTNYTITVTGASSTNANLTSSTSFTLNIQ